jgi:hypothetical protein
MADQLYLAYPTEDWTRTATLTATSSQTGYGASQAATDDPSAPWWADSTTATLTVTLSGTKEVGLIALIATNADAGKTITIAGGITGSPTLTGARNDSGYPKDLVYVVDPPQNLSAVTFAISGNTSKWSIGRVVVAKRRALSRTFPVGAYAPGMSRPQYTDENDFGHDIRYDLGVERRSIKGDLRLVHGTDLLTLETWWSATKAGYLPTLIVPNVNHITRYPPMFVRFNQAMAFDYHAPNMATVSLDLMEVCKGMEVVG